MVSGKNNGTVYLVGAGPGDPGLITLRGVELLRRADVVLYDRLIHPALLDYSPARAKRIYVGKGPGSRTNFRQNAIHTLMIEYARSGKCVVRLKGGDPFVFGRGGEEALALREAGIPCEVIPGVSSALAVPASAGIPMTHRGLSSSFAVYTAHESDAGDALQINWNAAASISTLVFLMGIERLPHLVSQLMLHGKSPDTPVAVIEKGTLPEEKIVIGTLKNIVEQAKGISPPATIIIGKVVTLSNSKDRSVTRTELSSGQFGDWSQADWKRTCPQHIRRDTHERETVLDTSQRRTSSGKFKAGSFRQTRDYPLRARGS